MSFKNKVVIVTGGSQGIGAATVDAFLEQGAKVASLDIVPSSHASNADLLAITCDITSEDSVKAAVDEVLAKFEKIDVLANVAGVMDNMARVSDLEPAMWNKCFAVNVTGPFNLTRHCIQHFLAKELAHKGSIVNVCSVASIRGACAGAAYTSSKHALLGLTRSIAWQYAKEGIRCNAVLPGSTKTNIMQNVGAEIDKIGLGTIMPYVNAIPGACEPVDIARAILFCASADAVNGAELVVDQGWTCA